MGRRAKAKRGKGGKAPKRMSDNPFAVKNTVNKKKKKRNKVYIAEWRIVCSSN